MLQCDRESVATLETLEKEQGDKNQYFSVIFCVLTTAYHHLHSFTGFVMCHQCLLNVQIQIFFKYKVLALPEL